MSFWGKISEIHFYSASLFFYVAMYKFTLLNFPTRVGYLAEERYSLHRQQSRVELQRQKSTKESRKSSSELEIQAKISKTKNGSVVHDEEHLDEDTKKLQGLQLFQSQVLGLLVKRMICTYRRWILFLLIVSRHF